MAGGAPAERAVAARSSRTGGDLVVGKPVYQLGETINLAFQESVVIAARPGVITVQTADTEIEVATDAVDCRITRVSPALGTPQAGEVWRDTHGQIWFARGTGDQVVLVGADERTQHPGRICMHWLDVHRESGPIERIWADAQPSPAAEVS